MSEDPKQGDESLPPELSADLKSLFSRKINFPAKFDENILNKTRGVIGRARRRRMWLPWMAVGAAAAAAIAIAIWRPGHVQRPTEPAQFALGAAPGADEKVNILPAYRLAKALQQGTAPAREWDKNSDGKVDQQDVNAWAAEAVKLDGGGTR